MLVPMMVSSSSIEVSCRLLLTPAAALHTSTSSPLYSCRRLSPRLSTIFASLMSLDMRLHRSACQLSRLQKVGVVAADCGHRCSLRRQTERDSATDSRAGTDNGGGSARKPLAAGHRGTPISGTKACSSSSDLKNAL